LPPRARSGAGQQRDPMRGLEAPSRGQRQSGRPKVAKTRDATARATGHRAIELHTDSDLLYRPERAGAAATRRSPPRARGWPAAAAAAPPSPLGAAGRHVHRPSTPWLGNARAGGPWLFRRLRDWAGPGVPVVSMGRDRHSNRAMWGSGRAPRLWATRRSNDSPETVKTGTKGGVGGGARIRPAFRRR
jgi:hypothetical protein